MSDLLGCPHDDWVGRLLRTAGQLGIPHAGRLRRIRRKRFLERLKHGDPAPWITRIRGTSAGSRLADRLTAWCAGETIGFPPPALPFQPAGKRATVVINTIDRANELEITLRDLADEWNADRDELIVVLGPTADDSERMVLESPVPATLVRCPERNLAISRNLGLEASRGDFVVFLDDDASPAAGWLGHLLAPFGNPEVGVVAGFVMDGRGQRFLNRHVVADTLGQAWWHDDEASAADRIAQVPAGRRFLTATGCNMAFRREALCGIGGFDPYYRYFLEETDAVLRLLRNGLQCAAAPDSRVRHRLGQNIARNPDFSPEQRTTIARSQLHYIAEFARGAVPADEIESAVWRRLLTDLEKIAWDRSNLRSALPPSSELQQSYLEALCGEIS